MKRIFLFVMAATLAYCLPAFAWDFDYGVEDVFQAAADTYVINTINIQKYNEGNGNTYYCPAANGIQASVTYKFDWCVPATNILVYGYFHILNAGSSYGYGSLWASTNGFDWQLLLDVPTPPSGAVGPVYSNTMPPSLTGSTSFWVQARLYSVGRQIYAQWLRDYNNGYPTPTFRVAADFNKPTVELKPAVLAHFDNLEIGQQYSIETSPDMTNWSAIGSLSATNASMVHTQYWMVGESPDPANFFRLKLSCPGLDKKVYTSPRSMKKKR